MKRKERERKNTQEFNTKHDIFTGKLSFFITNSSLLRIIQIHGKSVTCFYTNRRLSRRFSLHLTYVQRSFRRNGKTRSRDNKSRFFFSAGFHNHIIFLLFLLFFHSDLFGFTLWKGKDNVSWGYIIPDLFSGCFQECCCIKPRILGCVNERRGRHISLISLSYSDICYIWAYIQARRCEDCFFFTLCLLFSRKFPLWFYLPFTCCEYIHCLLVFFFIIRFILVFGIV